MVQRKGSLGIEWYPKNESPDYLVAPEECHITASSWVLRDNYNKQHSDDSKKGETRDDPVTKLKPFIFNGIVCKTKHWIATEGKIDRKW